MTTCTDWKAALATGLRNPSLWLMLAEHIEQHPEAWERETCQAMTAHLARLHWWRLMMENEAWHGTKRCSRCAGTGKNLLTDPRGVTGWACLDCSGGTVPTFALLFDREEVCSRCNGKGNSFHNECRLCNGTGKRIIPGHVSELAAYLESQGDKRAAAVRGIRGIRVERYDGGVIPDNWWVEPLVDLLPTKDNAVFFEDTGNMQMRTLHRAYPDACREAIKRVVEVFTEKCPCMVGRAEHVGCDMKICFGLKWVVTPERLPSAG